MDKIFNILKAAITVLLVVSRDALFWIGDKVISPLLSSLPNSDHKRNEEDEPDWSKAGVDPTYCENSGKKIYGRGFDYKS